MISFPYSLEWEKSEPALRGFFCSCRKGLIVDDQAWELLTAELAEIKSDLKEVRNKQDTAIKEVRSEVERLKRDNAALRGRLGVMLAFLGGVFALIGEWLFGLATGKA